MKTSNKRSKARRNYYVDSAMLLPFLLLLLTGVVLLNYHTGKPLSESTLSLDSSFWLNAHIAFSVISFAMIVLHLSLHLNWLKKIFSSKVYSKNWKRNLSLGIVFFIATVTAVVPWLILDDTSTASMLLGIHNKFGILLIVFFVIHLFSYWTWITTMTRNMFRNRLS